jgi:hypothetical protein
MFRNFIRFNLGLNKRVTLASCPPRARRRPRSRLSSMPRNPKCITRVLEAVCHTNRFGKQFFCFVLDEAAARGAVVSCLAGASLHFRQAFAGRYKRIDHSTVRTWDRYCRGRETYRNTGKSLDRNDLGTQLPFIRTVIVAVPLAQRTAHNSASSREEAVNGHEFQITTASSREEAVNGHEFQVTTATSLPWGRGGGKFACPER